MTQDRPTRLDEIDALARLVESHGSDRTRWPARERLRFAGLIAASVEAQALLKEEEALDRLLDLASTPSVARVDALAARIVAEAAADGRKVSVMQQWTKGGRAALRGGSFGRGVQGAGALMAACLLAGIFVGSAGVIDSAIEPFAVTAEDDGEGDATELALGLDVSGYVEEEPL